MGKIFNSLAALAVTAVTANATAAVAVLDFESIASYPNSNNVFALNYYNGGTSSIGTTGPNYGIQIGSNGLVICLNTLTVTCPASNTSRGATGAGSERGALFFLSGTETFVNVAAGFDTGFSFNYVSLNFSGAVRVYGGLNGTGSLLASIALTPNAGSCPAAYAAQFCPFSPIGVGFTGIAKSISFAGVANQIVFDITFGSITPGVPEPHTAGLIVAGLSIIGLVRRRSGIKRRHTDA